MAMAESELRYPTQAYTILPVKTSPECSGGEIGRHKRLKISRPLGRAGSIPARSTI